MASSKKKTKRAPDNPQLCSTCFDVQGPTGTNWYLGQSPEHPHKIAASFSPLPPNEVRPHVKINVYNQDYRTLIDSGASISLVNAEVADKLIASGLIQIHQSTVFVQDCHSHIQTTDGATKITFTIPSHGVNASETVLHITKNLSSDFLFGCDTLAMLGCTIDFHNRRIHFNPHGAQALRNSQHPIFLEAVASNQLYHVDTQLQSYIDKYTYAGSPLEDITIQPGDQIKFKVVVETDSNLQLTPGSIVLVQSDGSNLSAPKSVMETTFADVEHENKLSLIMANISCQETFLPKGQPIPGLTIQSMSAFHTPVQVSEDDLIIMANINDTFKEASKKDPTFLSRYEKAAAANAIHPYKTTQDQSRTDQQLFKFMKQTYFESVSALRQTSVPSIGRKTKPTQPCPEDVKKILLDQLDLSGTDKDWKAQYQNLVLENWDIFSQDRYDLGHAVHWEHLIEPIEEGLDPPFVKQYPIPVNDEPLLDEMAKTLVSRGVLIPQHSPGNSPVFIVRKPGSQPRFVQDLRQQNMLSKIDRYQILGLRESIVQAGKRKPTYFSTLDMSGAFWQLSLAEESRPWSAFTLPFLGTQLCWSRVPMGAKGSTASFAKFLHICFQKMPEMLTFVDDMMTMAQTNEEMVEILDKAFQILRLNNLKLNLKKCRLGWKEVTWLGFSISKNGVRPEMSKIEKCRQLQPPTTVKEIQSQLPFMAFNAQCLEEFQLVAGPLIDLTKKDSPWKSTKRHGPLPQKALEAWLTLKNMILERPVIAFADPALPYQIFCDASVGSMEKPGGISAVLTQVFDGVTKPIAYFSRRLRASEKKYDGFNAELLSVVSSLDHWRQLLTGADVTIFTDQKPIINRAARPRKTCAALIRKILEFDCRLQHIIGKDNQVADYLSRNLLSDDTTEETDEDQLPNKLDKAHQSLIPYPNTQFQQTEKTENQNKQNQNNQNQNIQNQNKQNGGKNSNSEEQNNNKDDSLVRLSNPINSTINNQHSNISSSTRMALIAKEHRSLGMVGSRRKFAAKGVAAAGVVDVNSKQLWQTEQAQDDTINALIEYVMTKTKPEEGTWQRSLINDIGHQVAMEDGLLYYYGSYRKSPLTKKLMVPKNLVTSVISESHDSCLGGHWGPETTIRTLMNTYFWPHMAMDVTEYIKRCPQCYITADRNARRTRSAIVPIPTPPTKNFRVHCDLVGPLVNSISDHKYILSMVDALTKWTVLVPIKDKTAEVVAEAIINHWILTNGHIQNLHSDAGNEFLNQVLKKIADYFKMTLHSTSAYNPKGNGQCERVHRSLGKFLTIFTNELGDNWITFLPSLQYALNTKCHTSTGHSPWFLHHGSHPIFPWRQEIQHSKRYGEDEATRRVNLIQYALEMVKTNDKEAKRAFAKAHNKKFKERGFKVGDFVLVHFPDSAIRGRLNRKMVPNWKGVFRITKAIGKNTYMVKKEGGRSTKVPVDRLKIYNEFLHLDDPDVQVAPEDPENLQHSDQEQEEQDEEQEKEDT